MPFVLDLTLTYAIIYLGRDNVLLSMILCFHQRKLQVESCKCSGLSLVKVFTTFPHFQH